MERIAAQLLLLLLISTGQVYAGKVLGKRHVWLTFTKFWIVKVWKTFFLVFCVGYLFVMPFCNSHSYDSSASPTSNAIVILNT